MKRLLLVCYTKCKAVQFDKTGKDDFLGFSYIINILEVYSDYCNSHLCKENRKHIQHIGKGLNILSLVAW